MLTRGVSDYWVLSSTWQSPTVTAEVASSSLVVPAILNKDFTLTSMKPAGVQKDTNLHPFVSLSLIAPSSLLWFPLCPALRNIGNRRVAPRRGEH